MPMFTTAQEGPCNKRAIISQTRICNRVWWCTGCATCIWPNCKLYFKMVFSCYPYYTGKTLYAGNTRVWSTVGWTTAAVVELFTHQGCTDFSFISHFVYLCICVFVYLCICVFEYLCICMLNDSCSGWIIFPPRLRWLQTAPFSCLRWHILHFGGIFLKIYIVLDKVRGRGVPPPSRLYFRYQQGDRKLKVVSSGECTSLVYEI